ncbi:hypothetical protein LQZ18_03835 [Lachnospiraceae bacterium ZAX-1]
MKRIEVKDIRLKQRNSMAKYDPMKANGSHGMMGTNAVLFGMTILERYITRESYYFDPAMLIFLERLEMKQREKEQKETIQLILELILQWHERQDTGQADVLKVNLEYLNLQEKIETQLQGVERLHVKAYYDLLYIYRQDFSNWKEDEKRNELDRLRLEVASKYIKISIPVSVSGSTSTFTSFSQVQSKPIAGYEGRIANIKYRISEVTKKLSFKEFPRMGKDWLLTKREEDDRETAFSFSQILTQLICLYQAKSGQKEKEVQQILREENKILQQQMKDLTIWMAKEPAQVKEIPTQSKNKLLLWKRQYKKMLAQYGELENRGNLPIAEFIYKEIATSIKTLYENAKIGERESQWLHEWLYEIKKENLILLRQAPTVKKDELRKGNTILNWNSSEDISYFVVNRIRKSVEMFQDLARVYNSVQTADRRDQTDGILPIVEFVYRKEITSIQTPQTDIRQTMLGNIYQKIAESIQIQDKKNTESEKRGHEWFDGWLSGIKKESRKTLTTQMAKELVKRKGIHTSPVLELKDHAMYVGQAEGRRYPIDNILSLTDSIYQKNATIYWKVAERMQTLGDSEWTISKSIYRKAAEKMQAMDDSEWTISESIYWKVVTNIQTLYMKNAKSGKWEHEQLHGIKKEPLKTLTTQMAKEFVQGQGIHAQLVVAMQDHFMQDGQTKDRRYPTGRKQMFAESIYRKTAERKQALDGGKQTISESIYWKAAERKQAPDGGKQTISESIYQNIVANIKMLYKKNTKSGKWEHEWLYERLHGTKKEDLKTLTLTTQMVKESVQRQGIHMQLAVAVQDHFNDGQTKDRKYPTGNKQPLSEFIHQKIAERKQESVGNKQPLSEFIHQKLVASIQTLHKNIEIGKWEQEGFRSREVPTVKRGTIRKEHTILNENSLKNSSHFVTSRIQTHAEMFRLFGRVYNKLQTLTIQTAEEFIMQDQNLHVQSIARAQYRKMAVWYDKIEVRRNWIDSKELSTKNNVLMYRKPTEDGKYSTDSRFPIAGEFYQKTAESTQTLADSRFPIAGEFYQKTAESTQTLADRRLSIAEKIYQKTAESTQTPADRRLSIAEKIYQKTAESTQTPADRRLSIAEKIYQKTAESTQTLVDRRLSIAEKIYQKTAESMQTPADRSLSIAEKIYQKIVASIQTGYKGTEIKEQMHGKLHGRFYRKKEYSIRFDEVPMVEMGVIQKKDTIRKRDAIRNRGIVLKENTIRNRGIVLKENTIRNRDIVLKENTIQKKDKAKDISYFVTRQIRKSMEIFLTFVGERQSLKRLTTWMEKEYRQGLGLPMQPESKVFQLELQYHEILFKQPIVQGIYQKNDTILKEGITSKDYTVLKEGITSKDHITLKKGITPKDHITLKRGIIPKDHTILKKGIASKNHITLKKGIISKDHTILKKGIASKDHTILKGAIIPQKNELEDILQPRTASQMIFPNFAKREAPEREAPLNIVAYRSNSRDPFAAYNAYNESRGGERVDKGLALQHKLLESEEWLRREAKDTRELREKIEKQEKVIQGLVEEKETRQAEAESSKTRNMKNASKLAVQKFREEWELEKKRYGME